MWIRPGLSTPARCPGTICTINIICKIWIIWNIWTIHNIQYLCDILTICNIYANYKQFVRYAINMQYGSIFVHLPIHHICIKYLAFLNCRQIRVLVLRLATFRTCNPAPPQTEWMLSEYARPQWMLVRLLGTSPARSAFAGKASECACVCARKAPARAAFAAVSTAAAFYARACAMTLQRAEVLDPLLKWGALAPPARRPRASKSWARHSP